MSQPHHYRTVHHTVQPSLTARCTVRRTQSFKYGKPQGEAKGTCTTQGDSVRGVMTYTQGVRP